MHPIGQIFATDELYEAASSALKIKPNSKTLRIFSRCLDLLLYNTALCASIMFVTHYKLKNKFITAQAFFAALGLVILFAILQTSIAKILGKSQEKVATLAKDLPKELISKQDIKSILENANTTNIEKKDIEKEADKIYSETKELQHQILRILTKGKAVPYADIMLDIVFATMICSVLVAIPYLKINKLGFLSKEFCNISAIVIASFFCLALLRKALGENIQANLAAELAHTTIHSNAPDCQVAQHLQILKCNRDAAKAMPKKEFKAKYKERVNATIGNLGKIICDEEGLKAAVTQDLANTEAIRWHLKQI